MKRGSFSEEEGSPKTPVKKQVSTQVKEQLVRLSKVRAAKGTSKQVLLQELSEAVTSVPEVSFNRWIRAYDAEGAIVSRCGRSGRPAVVMVR